MSVERLDHLFGHRAEVILADENGDTFVVVGAIQRRSGPGLHEHIEINLNRVVAAIDERNGAKYRPTFREVKLVDA